MMISGYLADWIKIKKILTLTQIRRYFTVVSFGAQALLLVLLSFLTDPIYCVITLIAMITAGAFSASGFFINPIDIAAQYASIIMGISNTFGK